MLGDARNNFNNIAVLYCKSGLNQLVFNLLVPLYKVQSASNS